MKRVSTVYFFCAIFTIISLSTPTNLFSALKFVSRNSNLVINPQPDSRVGLNKLSQISGFPQDSIIKIYGNNAPSSWTEAYTDEVTIGPNNIHQPSNMVYNNSNVLANLSTLTVNNSNATAPLPRQIINDSSTLISLTTLTRVDSNLILYLHRLEKNNSNAIVSAINTNNLLVRSNSQAIVNLSILVNANSNVIAASSALAKTTSTAIIGAQKSIRHNSSTIITISRLNRTTSNLINSLATQYNAIAQTVATHSHFVAHSTINGKLYFYKAGFDVSYLKTLSLNTPVPVSGNISLNSNNKNVTNGGTLSLGGDLYLGSNAYLTGGGFIAGNNYSLQITGSITLPSNSTWQITSNLLINGNDNTLAFGPEAQILLNPNVSVTLKNMHIKTSPTNPNIPILKCVDQTGILTLDNVTIDLANDFSFRTGRLFFNNDVRFTGTSCFIYQSWMQSYVMPQSLLTFDPGTTLYYYPSSTNQDLLKLVDESAGIYLKGSGTTLQTTLTGMRLTKGRLWLDNKVTITTTATTNLSSVTSLFTTAVANLAFGGDVSPNGLYLAEPNTSTDTIALYRINASSITQLFTAASSSNNLIAVKWNSDGTHFLYNANNPAGNAHLNLARFSQTGMTRLWNTTISATNHDYAWAPNGRYFALLIDAASNFINIYSFNGIATVSLVASTSVSGPGNVTWHPNSSIIALGFTSTVRLCTFDGASLTTLSTLTLPIAGSSSPGVAFDPSGTLLAVAATTNLYVYYFNGKTLSQITGVSMASNSSVPALVSWDPSGQYFAVAHNASTRIYNKYGTQLASIATSGTRGLRWLSNGTTLFFDDTAKVYFYTINYTAEKSARQAMTNGLIFGDSTLGSSSDLDVYFLAGARVDLNGMLFYNNVN